MTRAPSGCVLGRVDRTHQVGAFFGFNIGIGSDAITLDVTGPPEAQHVIASFAGA